MSYFRNLDLGYIAEVVPLVALFLLVAVALDRRSLLLGSVLAPVRFTGSGVPTASSLTAFGSSSFPMTLSSSTNSATSSAFMSRRGHVDAQALDVR